MADLDTNPISEPIISETIVVKPDIQTPITQSQGNKNVDFFFPDYIEYFLPSQSYLSCNVNMTGRGNPIPSPTAGFHSLFNTIRHYDGTNSNLLSESVQYNTKVGQMYTYSSTDALVSSRLNFEGLQGTDSYSNNIYWGLNGSNVWASVGANATTSTINSTPLITKSPQMNTTMKTFLLSTEKFVPLNVMGGLRTSLQIEDYRRSLEFTTGSLGVNQENGVCPVIASLLPSTSTQFSVTATAGDGYVNGNVYPVYLDPNLTDIRGYVEAKADGAITADAVWYCTSTGAFLPPNAGDILQVGLAGATITAGKIQVLPNSNLFSALRIGSAEAPYYVDVGIDSPAISITGATDEVIKSYGTGEVSSPFKCLNPIPNSTSGIDNVQFPNDNNPFSIGDLLYVSTSTTNLSETGLGIITGFSRTAVQVPGVGTTANQKGLRVYFQPNTAPVSGLPTTPANIQTGIAVTALTGGTAGTGFNTLFNSQATPGFKLYVKENDRLRILSTGVDQVRANLPTYCPLLSEQMNAIVGFQINDLQYQIKKVMVDPRVAQSDMAQAMGSGFTFDVEEDFTQLTNLTSTIGPTNTLISNPNITRALSVISIPLNQNNQFSILSRSLNGVAGNMTNYQFEMGLDGRQPIRAVNVANSSLANPLIQTQHIAELSKATEASGYFTSNLSKVSSNFAIGRAFSRPNMFYDLMSAGSLMLLANYETSASGPKLFVHFLHHLRSITFSRMGVSISN
tara:strand:- start:4455 stop:6665 length:2211 start_codon:yes stop_codon:yes gene_type:complete